MTLLYSNLRRVRPTEGPGAKLFEIRTARDLTILQVSKAIGIYSNDYIDYETGCRTAWGAYPGAVRSAVKIADFFGLKTEEIWGPDPRPLSRRSRYAADAVGNDRLIRERTLRGWTQAEAARRLDVHQVSLAQIEGFYRPCVNRRSCRFTKFALHMARLYERDPEWLFAEAFVRVHVRPKHDEIEVSEDFFGLEDSPEDVLARKQLCALAVSGLSIRQQFIVESRADGETLLLIGEQLGLSRERVRQIEEAALVKMRAALEAA